MAGERAPWDRSGRLGLQDLRGAAVLAARQGMGPAQSDPKSEWELAELCQVVRQYPQWRGLAGLLCKLPTYPLQCGKGIHTAQCLVGQGQP
jgi:hypothetical protein